MWWILPFLLTQPAEAASLWRTCADLFAGKASPAITETLPALGALDRLLKDPAFYERLASTDRHSLKIKDGKGSLKIGVWNRDQKKFAALMVKALREGSLREIDAGEITGPKVLAFLDGLREMGGREKLRFEIHGRFDLAFLRERAHQYQHALQFPAPSPFHWSDAEIAAWRKAYEHFGLDDCEARGLGSFVLRSAGDGGAEFHCR